MKENIFKNLLVISLLGSAFVGCSNDSNSATSGNNSSPIKNSSSTSTSKISSSSTGSSNNNSVTITSINIIGTYKQEYFIGEELDLTNVKLAITYSDGNKETINVTIDMITPVDMNTTGFKEIKVTYKGQTTSFFITIFEEDDPILPTEKTNAVVTFNFDNSATFTVGDEEKPSFTISEGADYTYHYYCEVKADAGETHIFYSYEELEPGYNYSLVVTVNENDLFYGNDGKDWRWFSLKAAPVEGKENAVVTFGFKAGTEFTVGDEEKPSFTISEGADYTYHYYCEDKDVAGEKATFDTYEELEPGYTYSLVVTVNENDLYYGNNGKDWCTFSLTDTEAQLAWKSKFSAVTKKWGTDGNNGVKKENVLFNSKGEVEISIDSLNRIGGAIESKDLYNQGSFEFEAKTNATNGVATAFWTYYYEDEYYEGILENGHINHEIDIELFGDNNAWFSSYIAEKVCTTNKTYLDYTLHDNRYHTYRFDWYNGEKIEYYIDNQLVTTITTNVPTKPMYVWIGAWCPSWAGEPTEGNFKMIVKSFKYTAF